MEYAYKGLNPRYVAVVRNLRFREPIVEPKTLGDRSNSKTEFYLTPGGCDGDLLLPDIDQKKTIGGFPFYDDNSDRLTVSSIDARNYLLGDIRTNAGKYISHEFVLRHPTAAPPFGRY